MLEHILRFEKLHLSPTELYEAMGYGSVTPDAMTVAECDAVIREVSGWVRPRFCYFIAPGTLHAKDETLEARDTVFGIGRIIRHQLRDSEAYAFFTATAGSEFEAYQQRLKQEGDMVRIYIADALGSVLAEKTADCMELALEKELEEKAWRHTNRFSPGYCGWHVSEQQKLFAAFPVTEPCGIRLTASSLMLPIKSVSGILGLGAEVRKQEYTCGLCTYEQCFRRKQRKQ